MDKNTVAFLKMLRWSEGTLTSPYTKCDGYDVVVSGINSPHIFTDFSQHPNIRVIFRPGSVPKSSGISTAAGGYQILYRYWLSYKALLSLPDFSPASQDAIAVRMISERGAAGDVSSGKLASAISKCSNIWASLPGNNYGQGGKKIDALTQKFISFGGSLAD